MSRGPSVVIHIRAALIGLSLWAGGALVAAPPVLAAATAQEAAELAKKALAGEDLAGALAHFIQAQQLAPDNQDYAHSAGVLSQQSGLPEQAVGFFRIAARLAAAAGNRADLVFYNEQISASLDTLPPWVDERIEQAARVPDGKERILDIWQRIRAGFEAAMAAGETEQALGLVRQAINTARDNLGDDHYVTFLSRRDQADTLFRAGRTEQAEPLFIGIIRDGVALLGSEHPEVQDSRLLLVDLYTATGRHSEAAQLLQEVRGIQEETLGRNHPRLFATTLSLAGMLQTLGRLDTLPALLADLCPRMADTLGPFHLETGRCRGLSGSVQMAGGNWSRAREAFEQNRTVQTAVLGASDPETLRTRANLAQLQRLAGRYELAAQQLHAALAEAKDDPVRFEIMAVLAKANENMGDFAAAGALTAEILEHERKTLGAEHPNTLTTMSDLAGIHRRQSRLAEAEQLYKASLDGFRKLFGENHPSVATSMNNLGLIQENQGLYDEAERHLRSGLEVSRRVLEPEHPAILANMNNLALLHESQGNFDQAEPHYLNVIEMAETKYGKDHPDTIAFVNNLAYLEMMRDDYAKALPLFERVLAVWTALLGEGHRKTLKALNNVARAWHGLGEPDKAQPLFERALRLRRETLGDRHMDTLRSMHDLGALLHDMGRHDAARQLLQETLTLADATVGPQHPYTFEAINSLADLLEGQQDLDAAFRMRREGFERRTRFLNRMLWATGDNAREGYLRLHRPELDGYLSLLSRLQEPAQPGLGVLEVGLQRKGLLLKITSEIKQIVRLGDNPELTALSEGLTAARKELASLTLSGPTETTPERHAEAIQELESKIDLLQLKLGQASQRFRRSVAAADVDQLVAALPETAALVDFIAYREGDRDKLLAVVLRKEDGAAVTRLVVYPDLEAIQRQVLAFRGAIQDEDLDDGEVVDAAVEAHALIWEPLVEGIGDRKRVYVVPDGILNILPFNAMAEPDGTYLLQSLDLHLLSTSRDLLGPALPEAGGPTMILAGPDYDSTAVTDEKILEKLAEAAGKRSASLRQGLRALSRGLRGLKFDPLPGAEKEGRLIAGQVREQGGESEIFIQNTAQEQVVQSLQRPPAVLHIATHGFFLKAEETLKKRLLKLTKRGASLHLPPPGDNPLLRAGLAFAGINGNARFLGEIDTANDGILTALEVLGLDLSGTRLAILSACETGLGEIHEGEGVYGLRRAFQESGVASVIASLWEVSDAGTQALMTGLYQRLGEGQSVHDALLGSQRAMLESSEWSYPYIWSAFMMVER